MHKFQAFYAESFFGILQADSTGAVTFANPVWTEITGMPGQSSLGDGWLDAFHSADVAHVLDAWRTSAAALRPLDVTARIIRPDGSRRFVRMRGRALPPGFDDPRGYVGLVLDMTEQVMAERRLRKNNELLSAVLENIPCGVTVYAANGSLILDNQKFRELLSPPRNTPENAITDFGTLSLEQANSAKADPDPVDAWRPSTGFDPSPRLREEIQPDGRVLEVRDAPMPTGGIVTTYTDITQHRQLIDRLEQAKAAAEQAAAAKAAFLANMSHEIRTPMNGVIGMTNVLLETKLTPDQRDLLQVIRQSGESLLVVINDILDYSRIESGQMELEWLPLRLRHVIENSVRLLSTRAQEKEVPVKVGLAGDIPGLLYCDRNRLQQVLVNLISNAVKFTQRGEIRISVVNVAPDWQHARPSVPGDLCTLAVTVQDTGIGIAKDKLDSIFEPFVQADSSTARQFGGTGLGLAIAKRLVTAMGGELRIRSQIGVGTTVCFTFLAEVADSGSRADRHALLQGKNVLLVSGKSADAGVLVQQLTRWGMKVFPCRGSAEALSALGKGSFDLVLVASHSVDTRGPELVRALRAASIPTPVVLLSRKRQVETLDAALHARVVSRSASEAALCEALVEALQADGSGRVEHEADRQFDPTLADRAPLRILLAEDNEINRRVALRMLAGFGYEADVAHNGAEVIDQVCRRSYDLVLMDIEMPEVDGMAATRFILENGGQQRPRVVAMSANVMKEHVDAALAAGADEYIAKPFSPTELRLALENASSTLRKSRARVSAVGPPRPQVLSEQRLRLHARGDRDGEFLASLVSTFAQSSAHLLSRLREAVRHGDAAAARAILHEYSGMCAVLGAEKLMHLTQVLHTTIQNADLRRGDALVERCEAGCEETLSALQQFLQHLRAGR